jgi:hypothetical protein
MVHLRRLNRQKTKTGEEKRMKEKFSETDWAMVLEAPLLAGLAVTAADPGGLISAFQESSAVASGLKSAATDGGDLTLAAAIAAAYGTSEGRKAAAHGARATVKGKRPAEASTAAIARLGEIQAVVASSTPDQANGFRTFLLDVAQDTAEASTEGGFLGFGGDRVSQAEQDALDALRAALGALS